MMERSVPDSVSAVQNFTNATRDVESDFETGQEGKIREIVMDNNDAEPKVSIIAFTIFGPSNHESPYLWDFHKLRICISQLFFSPYFGCFNFNIMSRVLVDGFYSFTIKVFCLL